MDASFEFHLSIHLHSCAVDRTILVELDARLKRPLLHGTVITTQDLLTQLSSLLHEFFKSLSLVLSHMLFDLDIHIRANIPSCHLHSFFYRKLFSFLLIVWLTRPHKRILWCSFLSTFWSVNQCLFHGLRSFMHELLSEKTDFALQVFRLICVYLDELHRRRSFRWWFFVVYLDQLQLTWIRWSLDTCFSTRQFRLVFIQKCLNVQIRRSLS